MATIFRSITKQSIDAEVLNITRFIETLQNKRRPTLVPEKPFEKVRILKNMWVSVFNGSLF